MVRKFIDAAITGVWCFLWVVPAFMLYFAASLLTHLLLSTKPIKTNENEHNSSDTEPFICDSSAEAY